MFLRCILLVLSIPPLAETCVPTVPPDEYYPTASLPEETTRPMQVTPVPPEMSTTAGGGGVTMASTTAEAENMCADCDINAIAPVLADPVNTAFESDEDPPVNGCKQTYVLCQTTDNKNCDTIEMLGTNADGTSSIADLTVASSVTSTLSCGADGKYSHGTVTGITQITCNFLDCT
ncbi:hypothetical protein CAEBREN_14818 [Caenorhabditis brenneri]|uniref:DUF281 domain-containing protein n=1 Tax=Caenorhabditis brenneri TaxID=135651 RepID=G0MCW0_CAEBE|nr:hypothetical protein CAEBREN_14818 [Caenorhabditis brenneri]